MKTKIDWKRGILIFLCTFIGVFLVFFIVVNPMVQDAYNKGWLRGINESCDGILDKVDWQNKYPTGLPNISLNVSNITRIITY
jgi:hypothetical protein